MTFTQITEDTFEAILYQFRKSPDLDLRDVNFIDPYGMIGLLEAGELYSSHGVQKTLYLPDSEEVLNYLERMAFFRFAKKHFRLEPFEPEVSDRYRRSFYSDVLLEITPIEKSDDIHLLLPIR